jgi:hypothetical protein
MQFRLGDCASKSENTVVKTVPKGYQVIYIAIGVVVTPNSNQNPTVTLKTSYM